MLVKVIKEDFESFIVCSNVTQTFSIMLLAFIDTQTNNFLSHIYMQT